MSGNHPPTQTQTQTVPFGREMLQKHFLLDPAYVNLNHGSFGSTVRPVLAALHTFQAASEAAPDRYIRYEYPHLLDASRQAAATYLNVPVDELVLVANVTTAINAVLRNLAPTFVAGDVILYIDTVYGGTLKTIDYVVDSTPATSVRVEFELPCGQQEILARFREAFEGCRKEGKKVKVALFDTIASLPGVRLPFEEMNAIARAEGALTLVDGAHAMGHFPLDLKSLDADFFTSNCHKWLYTPRGSAILHIPTRNHHLMRSSLPTSHWYEPLPQPNKPLIPNPLPPSTKSNFVQQFEFVGTVDNAALLCIPAALKFRKEVCGGEQIIMQYCWDLASKGGEAVAKVLGTEVMQDTEKELRRECAMVMVRMPIDVKNGATIATAEAQKTGARVQSWMCEEMVRTHGTFIAIVFYKSRWWARFSAQIYLELGDFEWGATVLVKLCEKAAQKFPGDVVCLTKTIVHL